MLDKGVTCPVVDGVTFSASVDVDVEVVFTSTLDYAFALSGTIVPPAITEFALGAGMDFSLGGKLSIEIIATVRARPSAKQPIPYANRRT